MNGLLDDAVAFYAELGADNTPQFWTEERHRYDDGIRPLLAALVDGLSVDRRWTAWRIYRPYNSQRFSRSTPPYKDFAAAVSERADGVGVMVRFDARGLLLGSGIPMPAPDQLAAQRSAIAGEPGENLERAVAVARDRGAVVRGGRWEPLRGMPRGYRADHPRAELLRWRGIEANTRLHRPVWTTLEEATHGIADLLDRPRELHDWLGAHVGPSALTPEERFAPRAARRA
ncbi:MAG: DUF2461 family protein [Phycicoccus sp.]